MTRLVSRTYAGAQDLQSMLDLLAAVRPADRITDSPSPVDLHELMALPEVQNNTRLWLGAGGRLAGFAFVDQYNNLRWEVDWPAAGPDIEPEIVAWGVECIRRGTQESGTSVTLDASCRDDDTERIALLERHGFVRQELRSLHMAHPLDEPIPAPHLPAGFSIRHVTGEQEAEALVALHRAAFGTDRMTVEERLAMMRVPEYERELDLLAVAPDGRLAAYCMCSISREENERSGRNEGYTDPVATHPDFQRLGLARALVLAGLHELKRRGVDTAVTGTSSENVAMQRTAEAVGFRVTSTTLWFAKPVDEDYRIAYVDNPEESAWGIIGRGVGSYNRQQAGQDQHQYLCFALRAPDETIVGGVMAATYWDWLFIDLLWVQDDLRGRGYGHRLLTMAEDEARRRGAKNAYLDTFSFQAPDFYKRHGYQVFGELRDFPRGHQRYFLTKQL